MITNMQNGKVTISPAQTPKDYRLDEFGQFRIEHYEQKPAFAGFLPGIGGPDGVPLWCLYVNRAQAVSSFGVGNKDHAIVEFLPANWAYQLVGVQGFRTFCKIDGEFYEPFQNDVPSGRMNVVRTMWVGMDRLKLREENQTLGLRFEVSYFSPVNQPLGSLARLLTITNLSPRPRRLECLDGLPLVIPAGFSEFGIKMMRRIHEAYASVRITAGHVPFFAAKVMAHDEAEVEEVRKGNFYAAWLSDGHFLFPIEPYYDPDLIFGSDQDLIVPRQFIRHTALDRSLQVAENKLPCAMAPFELTLEPDDSVTLVALCGMAPDESMLPPFLANFKTPSDFEQASQQSSQLIRTVTQPAFMVSSAPQLDAYARQNYLDNVLRGGIPEAMPSANGPTLIHLYARRHGDAERDYNFFDLPACPLSSGEGNYRDICQNRRSDVWFYPDVWDQEIRMFVSLLQADGYNPLSIKGYRWRLPASIEPATLCPPADPDAQAAFTKLLARDFLPGQLLAWADHYHVALRDRKAWLTSILSRCDTALTASGHEGGYWIDHWTYILDLIEAFETLYPDRLVAMLTQQADIEWFFEPARVADRKHKYLRRANGPLQLNAVVEAPVPAVALPRVTVFAKLCAVLAIKAVSLDYEGRGIEMEAGRPAWNDAMNGLPGLFGSSTCETAETLRLAKWLLKTLPNTPEALFPVHVADFIQSVQQDLDADYDWNRAATLREAFRSNIYNNAENRVETVSGQCLRRLLEGVIARCERGLSSAVDPASGLLHTYYLHRPVDAKDRPDQPAAAASDDPKSVRVDIARFAAEPLPLFLEGQVHWLRVCSPTQAAAIYRAVKNSPLLDKQLAMYKLNECLERCSPEIGRARTFSRGWFENESIWLHMSGKYLLELVRQGLFDEFFADARTMLVPFMDPDLYGRSILENSSFIASSDCPDPQARGRGFVARLSGTTAEFIHIWLLLTAGKRPFRMHDGRLTFTLEPSLPADWFTAQPVEARWNEKELRIPEKAFACALLGTILLVYHNPSGKNTYGPDAVRPVKYVLDNERTVVAPELSGPVVEDIRQRRIQRIDVWLE
jgi:hypothetical protein